MRPVSTPASSKASLALVLASFLAVGISGCAGDGGSGSNGGDPGARPLAAGQSCQSIKSELNTLQSRGVGSKADSASSGRKLSEKEKADVGRYNSLLNQYLGARCHV